MPSLSDIQYCIDFVSWSILPYLQHYRISPMDHEELHQHKEGTC